MAPDHKAQEANSADGVDHGAIAEHRLAREGGQDVRGHAHARQYGDVHLWVAEEPEKMLPEQRGAAGVLGLDDSADHQAAGNKKAGAGNAVEQKQNSCGEEHAESQQAENRGDEPGPHGEGQAH